MDKNRSYHLFPGDQFSVIAKDFLFEIREKHREKRKHEEDKFIIEPKKNVKAVEAKVNLGKQEKTSYEMIEITGDIFESKDSIVQVLGQGRLVVVEISFRYLDGKRIFSNFQR